ncbi:hypothetical protein NPX13_g2702 [Xylaria arbuscula]|uniref:AAA+ ATPase domain-containing protein n=1 Tax=Xylaria arbuscula TaxID=114810 RepID=A0A9W8NJK7_9PEZI|nr:hypothetical protein NPX13_g2702 [Xylaria arbuscula]
MERPKIRVAIDDIYASEDEYESKDNVNRKEGQIDDHVESSSITISDDFSHSDKVEERQFLALRDTKKKPKNWSTRNDVRYSPKWMPLMPHYELPHLASTKLTARDLRNARIGGYQDNSGKRLHSQLQLDDGIASLDQDELQDYIERLQKRAKDLSTSSVSKSHPEFTYRTLYRIMDFDNDSKPPGNENPSGPKQVLFGPFFDPPQWMGSNRDGTLRCQVPVNNFDLFLERNKDISFIVYKTYSVLRIMQQTTFDPRTDRPQIKIEESIKPITQGLMEAIRTLLTSKHEYATLWSSFKTFGELHGPYLFVYHQRTNWHKMCASIETSSKEQMTTFWDYIIQNHGDEFAAADACISQGKINAKYVPYLYIPGEILVQKQEDSYLGWCSTSWAMHNNASQTTRDFTLDMTAETSRVPLYETEETSEKMSNEKLRVQSWSIDAWHWEFNGNFQRKRGKLQFSVVADTVASSQRFENVKLSDTRNETMSIQDLQVDERYMIDLKAYRSLHKDNQFDQVGNRKGLIDELGPEAMKRDELPDDKFQFLVPATIKGFNMRRKKWYDLLPERVREVEWNKAAFQKVVMNSKEKDLIQALVSNQLAVEASTPDADLIEGKGNGLILLLHGSPGTGKTLTAESVAEIAEKPLYRVTCADIGTKAEDAEKYLESILHLGKLWRCVVLLDEAEVFLEERGLEDLERNALVSVFLRILEYYEGILILTTNRVGTFDEAFKSRIQLALHYPTLGPYQRLRVWENFLERYEKLQDDTVETGDLRDHLDELSKEDMNGRQIRNALTTARQYAKWKGEKLNYAKLKDVIEVAGQFDKYLVKLHKGLTHDELAEDQGLR